MARPCRVLTGFRHAIVKFQVTVPRTALLAKGAHRRTEAARGAEVRLLSLSSRAGGLVEELSTVDHVFQLTIRILDVNRRLSGRRHGRRAGADARHFGAAPRWRTWSPRPAASPVSCPRPDREALRGPGSHGWPGPRPGHAPSCLRPAWYGRWRRSHDGPADQEGC